MADSVASDKICIAPTEGHADAPYDVFVCYSRKGAQKIADIETEVRILETQWKLRVFLDERESWSGVVDDKIRSAIRQSAVFLLIVTRELLGGGYAHDEELPLIVSRAEEGGCEIIPILCENLYPDDAGTEQLKYALRMNSVRLFYESIWRQQEEYRKLREMVLGAMSKLRPHRKFTVSDKSGGAAEDLSAREEYRVIGWSGIENSELYDTFDGDVKCLVAQKSFDTPPMLSLDGKNKFDAIIADIELFSRYRKIGCVKPFDGDALEQSLREMLHFLKTLVSNGNRGNKNPIGGVRQHDFYGIPLQFGFNEILVNKSRVKGDLKRKLDKHYEENAYDPFAPTISYKDFNIKNLLNSGHRIGLWGWYLPTICHLLLPDFCMSQHDNLTHFSDYCSSAEAERAISAILALLREHGGTGVEPPYDRLSKAIDQLSADEEEGGVDILLGGSSAILEWSNVRDVENIVPIIPREGVLTWVNCAALLCSANYAPLFEHWLSMPVQMNLWKANDQYKGFPVNSSALVEIIDECQHRNKWHASFASLACLLQQRDIRNIAARFANCSGDDSTASRLLRIAARRRHNSEKVNFALRPFPEAWRLWAKEWEDFEMSFQER